MRWLIVLLALGGLVWLVAWRGMGCHLRGGYLEALPGPGKQVVCTLPEL